MTKVIIVADEQIHQFFTDKYPEWDTQSPVVDVRELWNMLETGKLDTHSEIVIISDQYFDQSGQDTLLEETLATLSINTLTMLIVYEPENKNIILGKTRNIFEVNNPGVTPNDVYTISRTDPITDVERNIDLYRRKLAAQDDTTVSYDVGATHNNTLDAEVEEDRKGMILVSTSSKGGSGKSSVSVLLASQIAKSSEASVRRGLAPRKLDVVLVDLDIFDGQLGFLMGRTSPTALNVRAESDWSIKTIKKYLIHSDRLGFSALLAPKRGRTAVDVTPEFYNTVIDELRKAFDLVILDTSVQYLDNLLKKVALPKAHAILFVTDLGVASVMGMNRWFEETTTPVEDGGYGLDINKIGIVVNKSLPSVGMDKERIIEASAGAQLLSAIPMDSQAFLAASNRNRLEELIEGHPDIGPAYFKLARKIIGNRYNLVEVFNPQGFAQSGGSGERYNRSQPQPSIAPQQQGHPHPQAQQPPQGYNAPSVKPKKKGFFRRGK